MSDWSVNPIYLETRFRISEGREDWPDEFVIVSAYATTGQAWTDQENEAADQRLASELASGTGWFARITGYSPSSGHAEPSWAVGVPLDEGRALGLAYRQDAVYHVRKDLLSVSCCIPSCELMLIGSFRERLDTAM
jgi:hypothetical protein